MFAGFQVIRNVGLSGFGDSIVAGPDGNISYDCNSVDCASLPPFGSGNTSALNCDTTNDSDGNPAKSCYYTSITPQEYAAMTGSAQQVVQSVAPVQQAGTGATITTKAQLDAALTAGGGTITVAANSGALTVAQQGLGFIEYSITKLVTGQYQIKSTNYLMISGIALGSTVLLMLLASKK